MKRPKSCDGCKAHYQSQWRHTCELGYEICMEKTGSLLGADIVRIYPKGGCCPKPRTYAELMDAPKAWEVGAK